MVRIRVGQFFQHLAQTTPRSQQEPAADCISILFRFSGKRRTFTAHFFKIVILNEVRERMF